MSYLRVRPGYLSSRLHSGETTADSNDVSKLRFACKGKTHILRQDNALFVVKTLISHFDTTVNLVTAVD